VMTLGTQTGRLEWILANSLCLFIQRSKSNVLFESTGVPNEWELNNLHVIELTGPHWDPTSLEMPIRLTHEMREMKSIRSLRNVASTAGTLVELCECVLEQISPVYSELNMTKCMILNVKIARFDHTTDTAGTGNRISAAHKTNRHDSKVTPESLAKKWNIGLGWSCQGRWTEDRVYERS
jgi:hypothetical protein